MRGSAGMLTLLAGTDSRSSSLRISGAVIHAGTAPLAGCDPSPQRPIPTTAEGRSGSYRWEATCQK